MTTESTDSGLPSMSAAEDAFFASGGEAPISETPETPETPTPETPPAEKADKASPGDKTPPDRLLAAVHEERSKRKALEKQFKESQERLANFEGRFAVLDKLAPKAPGEAEAPVIPTAEDDIFGKVKHTDETVAQIQKRLDDAEAASKASADQTTFKNRYIADANAFEAKNKDYRPAYNHLLQSRAQELMAIGYDDPMALQAAGADPAEVQAAAKALHDALVADEAAIAQLAFSKNKSPAEIIYGLAKQRGYKLAAAPGAAPEKSEAEKALETIERGQAANKSLNDAAGTGSGDTDMTAERLLAMDMPEYEAWVAKNPAKARAIMGG